MPQAIFGIDNDGVGVFANLLVIFLIAIWFALVFWTYSDARRRLEDGVLIGSATLAALIFPFAGALVYAIVRPPETLDDAYERDLDVRAAELRVRLLENAVKGGPGTSQALADELQGEPTTRRSSQPPASSESGSRRQEGSAPRRPESSAARPASPGSSAPSPSRSSQPPRPSQGGSSAPRNPSSRPPIAGSDGA